jgi:hypothetical protein
MMYTYRGHYIIEQPGSLLGQKSQVMRAPGAGLGIVVTTNDHEFGTAFTQVVQRRILDYSLGLKPINWLSK